MRKRNSIEFPAFYNVGVGEGGVCWLGAPSLESGRLRLANRSGAVRSTQLLLTQYPNTQTRPQLQRQRPRCIIFAFAAAIDVSFVVHL